MRPGDARQEHGRKITKVHTNKLKTESKILNTQGISQGEEQTHQVGRGDTGLEYLERTISKHCALGLYGVSCVLTAEVKGNSCIFQSKP